jgi:hypothetical protein
LFVFTHSLLSPPRSPLVSSTIFRVLRSVLFLLVHSHGALPLRSSVSFRTPPISHSPVTAKHIALRGNSPSRRKQPDLLARVTKLRRMIT